MNQDQYHKLSIKLYYAEIIVQGIGMIVIVSVLAIMNNSQQQRMFEEQQFQELQALKAQEEDFKHKQRVYSIEMAAEWKYAIANSDFERGVNYWLDLDPVAQEIMVDNEVNYYVTDRYAPMTEEEIYYYAMYDVLEVAEKICVAYEENIVTPALIDKMIGNSLINVYDPLRGFVETHNYLIGGPNWPAYERVMQKRITELFPELNDPRPNADVFDSRADEALMEDLYDDLPPADGDGSGAAESGGI